MNVIEVSPTAKTFSEALGYLTTGGSTVLGLAKPGDVVVVRGTNLISTSTVLSVPDVKILGEPGSKLITPSYTVLTATAKAVRTLCKDLVFDGVDGASVYNGVAFHIRADDCVVDNCQLASAKMASLLKVEGTAVNRLTLSKLQGTPRLFGIWTGDGAAAVTGLRLLSCKLGPSVPDPRYPNENPQAVVRGTVRDAYFYDCTITNTRNSAVRVTGGGDIWFDRCTFANVVDLGVNNPSTLVSVRRVRFTRCTFNAGTDLAGLRLLNGAWDVDIFDCTFNCGGKAAAGVELFAENKNLPVADRTNVGNVRYGGNKVSGAPAILTLSRGTAPAGAVTDCGGNTLATVA